MEKIKITPANNSGVEYEQMSIHIPFNYRNKRTAKKFLIDNKGFVNYIIAKKVGENPIYKFFYIYFGNKKIGFIKRKEE